MLLPLPLPFPTRRSSDLQDLDDVGVALHVLEDLLLQLEPQLILDGGVLLQDLDGDLAPVSGLGLGPDLLTEVRLGEARSEEHTSELQTLRHLVCRLLLEK